MPSIGPMELIVVLVIALLVLGPKRLPAAGRSLGRGITEFRAGISGKGAESTELAQPASPVAAEPPTAAGQEPGAGDERRKHLSMRA
jgi:sec-independent protein translocase protein TatA